MLCWNEYTAKKGAVNRGLAGCPKIAPTRAATYRTKDGAEIAFMAFELGWVERGVKLRIA